MLIRRAALWLIAGGALAILTSACGRFDSAETTPTVTPDLGANTLMNGGFEAREASWTFKQQPEWSGFSISDSVARSGKRSLALQLRGDAGASGTHIAGALQTIATEDFPEYLSGFYRVDDWKPNAPFQYLQFVVIVRGGNFDSEFDVVEVRFPLAGAERQPFDLSNARFIFLDTAQPKLHRWVYFGYPLRQAFETSFGKVPTKWDSIEAFFEVRYDGKVAGGGASSADVFFDDLYAGPEKTNPNHPEE